MTNITLSIRKDIYSLMKKHSEIKWSEFIRKAVEQRINELQKIEKDRNKEGIWTMVASEDVLKKDWDNNLDERWNNV